jgi:Nuclease-related domain
MAARLFPDAPTFASKAEELFVASLRENLPADAVLICGRRFSDRREDREADVIVGWPGVGIAVVEVKGGSVYLAGGEWRQAGNGEDNVIHPVD